MPLNIKDPEIHQMARTLAELTGESITQAVGKAIRERLRKIEVQKSSGQRRLADRLNEIADHCAALPVFDDRSDDEILGYDDTGMPS